MNRLFIEPLCGLANRMRVIASALEFKKQFGCEVFCIWSENSELNAPFNKLFEDVDGLNFIPKSKKMKVLLPDFHPNFIVRLLAKISNKILGFNHCIRAKDVHRLVDTNILYDIVKNNKGAIYLRSYNIDYNWDTEHFNSVFRPKRAIMERIESIYSKFSRYSEVVGLHIRRTDNAIAIANSPIELFINEIENKIKDNDNAGFFLATDDKDTEDLLQKLYPGKIIVEQKNLNRDSLEGIQDAVVDMFALSKTSMIYGSYWSSFSTISGKIGGIECIRLQKT